VREFGMDSTGSVAICHKNVINFQLEICQQLSDYKVLK
jgi:hypothetical protein